MNIESFDEGLDHRKILAYDTVYRELSQLVCEYVQTKLDVTLVHIGSTAIADLRGKPMLDFAAVTSRDDLRAEQKQFESIGFHRRSVWVDRDDKPYVCGSVMHNGRRFNINIHICHHHDSVHKDSLAFMKILSERPDLRRLYEQAKDHAHSIDPVNPEVYNRAKEGAIKAIHEQIQQRNNLSAELDATEDGVASHVKR